MQARLLWEIKYLSAYLYRAKKIFFYENGLGLEVIQFRFKWIEKLLLINKYNLRINLPNTYHLLSEISHRHFIKKIFYFKISIC